ncbi:MAG: hypothetical protein ACTS73_04290 [Arsenophonus sp. NEOnobi-MAG3]
MDESELVALKNAYREPEARTGRTFQYPDESLSLTVSPKIATGDGALDFLECNGNDIPEYAAATLLGGYKKQVMCWASDLTES